MNLGRDPRWGRFQESISEDPFLNGAYSTQFVKAMKGNDSHYLQVTLDSGKSAYCLTV